MMMSLWSKTLKCEVTEAYLFFYWLKYMKNYLYREKYLLNQFFDENLFHQRIS